MNYMELAESYMDFAQDERVEAFYNIFGGGFGYLGSTPFFTYHASDDNVYIAPENEPVESMYKMVQESMDNNRNLFVERWKLFKPNPDCLY